MHKKAAMLEDRGVVSVSGADAAGFLQGLLTNDVEGLEPGEARYAALLTPQGKILFDMIVVRAPGARSLPISSTARRRRRPISPSGSASTSCAPRSRSPTRAPSRAVAAFWGDETPSLAEGLLYADPRDPRLGWRAILPRPVAAALGTEHASEYEGLRIAVGAPKGGLDFAYGGRLPARRQFRSSPWGRFRQGLLCRPGGRLAHEASRNGAQAGGAGQTGRPAPAPGTPVLDRELAVGALGSSSGREALALFRLDRAEEATGGGPDIERGRRRPGARRVRRALFALRVPARPATLARSPSAAGGRRMRLVAPSRH